MQQLRRFCLQTSRQTGNAHLLSNMVTVLLTVEKMRCMVGNMVGPHCCLCKYAQPLVCGGHANTTDAPQVAEQLEHQGGRILWRVRPDLQLRFQLPAEIPRDVADALSKPIAVSPRVLKGKRTSGGDPHGTELPAMPGFHYPNCWSFALLCNDIAVMLRVLCRKAHLQ